MTGYVLVHHDTTDGSWTLHSGDGSEIDTWDSDPRAAVGPTETGANRPVYRAIMDSALSSPPQRAEIIEAVVSIGTGDLTILRASDPIYPPWE